MTITVNDQQDELEPGLIAAARAKQKTPGVDTLDGDESTAVSALTSPPSAKKIRAAIRRQAKKDAAELKAHPRMERVVAPEYAGPPVRIGIDAEYVCWPESPDGPINEVLSIAAVVECGGLRSRYVYTPKGAGREDRPRLEEFIQGVLTQALRERVIPSMPNRITIYGHFIRADLPSFRNFWARKREFRGLGRTVVSGREGLAVNVSVASETAQDAEPAPGAWGGLHERAHLRDLDGQAWRVKVRFIDTIRLTPGQKGLAYAGELIGKSKLDLHDDLGVPRTAAPERPEREGWGLPAIYGIERMDLVLRDHAQALADYNYRDAEITLDYGIFMERFAREELGLRTLPPTIAGCASGLIRRLAGGSQELAKLIGRSTQTRTYYDEQKRAYRTRRSDDFTPALSLYYGLASKFYHGGRNECFFHGPTPVRDWYDYDLPGAYATALMALRPIDYVNIRQELDPDAYDVDDMGIAWIEFEFPPGTRFPCLPVRGESEALFFPLKGTQADNVFVGAPEIRLARRMGATIRIIQGFKAPWASEDRIFGPFTRMVLEKRRHHPKTARRGLNELWKEVGNSGYGLLAQGLREKRVFDPATMRGQVVGLSALTEPFHAAWVTSFIRAVLGEVLAGVPDTATVVSATTDGLLLDTGIDQLALDGPLCRYFADLRENLFGAREVLDPQPKHGARQLVSVAVRTTFTARTRPGFERVCAKGGVRPPCRPSGHNRHMLRLYLEQHPGQTVTHEQLISAREQFTRESDLISITRTRRLNLTYDFKRRPVRARLQPLGHHERVAWDTEPWETVRQAEFARVRVNGWRRDRERVFRSLADFDDWAEYHAACEAAKDATAADGLRPPPVLTDNAWGMLKRAFLQAGRTGIWGVRFAKGEATEISRILTDSGFPTGKEDVTYAARRAARLIPHSVAVTAATVTMLRVILRHFPSFDYRQAFRVADLPRLEMLLQPSQPGVGPEEV